MLVPPTVEVCVSTGVGLYAEALLLLERWDRGGRRPRVRMVSVRKVGGFWVAECELLWVSAADREVVSRVSSGDCGSIEQAVVALVKAVREKNRMTVVD